MIKLLMKIAVLACVVSFSLPSLAGSIAGPEVNEVRSTVVGSLKKVAKFNGFKYKETYKFAKLNRKGEKIDYGGELLVAIYYDKKTTNTINGKLFREQIGFLVGEFKKQGKLYVYRAVIDRKSKIKEVFHVYLHEVVNGEMLDASLRVTNNKGTWNLSIAQAHAGNLRTVEVAIKKAIRQVERRR